ncbi:XRE family transcriptional regulator [Endozoicomonas sp. SM1973]|uniref:XRE family transcriptional regulator n=1 Tax=Spartinivicinus marinus TaxID=2994442 RepID=A0A853IGG0_9GAMM|nr:XRE family transcriptional regulator [Spartinivicinus marinus]NYZ69628.1 XRE family transcriptional regulator [Spartinivicinus marinus]
MAKHISKLRAKMSPEAREKAKAKTESMLKAMPLAELRQALELSQKTLAESLDITQASVSKIEQRTDMYISTLRRYIEAMGGELTIKAHFPEGDIEISQFESLHNSHGQALL